MIDAIRHTGDCLLPFHKPVPFAGLEFYCSRVSNHRPMAGRSAGRDHLDALRRTICLSPALPRGIVVGCWGKQRTDKHGQHHRETDKSYIIRRLNPTTEKGRSFLGVVITSFHHHHRPRCYHPQPPLSGTTLTLLCPRRRFLESFTLFIRPHHAYDRAVHGVSDDKEQALDHHMVGTRASCSLS
ncbi:hypothetical protein P170DRAFT_199598 [Aspergillus steynii IBT 23096]|uniref:Uncharacterized protein n=1 Tax=Aspergillus steynii IBT 23096 TaxID=1392250 RepID=A0A2I2G4U3_9EURO|nr:uncharacterized protein P170DRAFT_199598 [Aspergillus steynii IBT 23096]PLB47899.1 hypothetical protein P170DRAFT_199598 [Aspergillus steynii IBT 23096]